MMEVVKMVTVGANSEAVSKAMELVMEHTEGTTVEDAFTRGNMTNAYSERLHKPIAFEVSGVFSKFEDWRDKLTSMAYFVQDITNDEKIELIAFISEITEEEYLTRKTSKGQKLGKQLRKLKASQAMLDYDGSHERSQVHKRYMFAINGEMDAILNMSGYALMDSWNGYQGTSCQDYRHAYNGNTMNLCLLGSLASRGLYVGQLLELEEGEEVEDFTMYDISQFEDRLIARVNLFHVEHGTRLKNLYIVNDHFYGNSFTKPILKEVLEEVAKVQPLLFY